MYRSFVVFGLYLSFAIAVGAACGPAPLETPSDDDDDSSPRGGTTGSGGSSTGGTGNIGTGGTGNFGTGGTGNVGTGGTGNVGTGGTVSTGGTSNAGRSNGGSPAGAGRAAGGSAGAATGTGGTVATGGTTGTTGGTGGTVGAAGTGTSGSAGTGSSVTCDTTFKVDAKGFVRMPGKGGACYSGYAFGGGDKTSTVTFPGGGTDFSMSAGVLELKGTVGSATEANSYAGNVYFGFNVAQASGGTKSTVKPAGTSLTVTCTGCATPPMRVQLVGAKQWCAPLTSGTAVAYTTFKTECWEGGVTQTPYDGSAIESIQISIPGGAADATFDFTLMSVTET